MRKSVLTLSALGVAALLAVACTPQAVKDVTGNNTPTAVANAAAGTDTCMTCHGDGTVLNDKIQNARDTWMTSVHAKGMTAALADSTGKTIGLESEGPDSFYANGGSCQVCHTKEGYNKKAADKYADAKAESDDYIQGPSSLTCFTCHKPHTNGNFDLVWPASKSVTLKSGVVYNKDKGSICASCHQSRTAGGDGAAVSLAAVKTNTGISVTAGAHHGPQADLLMGTDGARFPGKTYDSGAHTTQANANCLTCHMTYPSGSRFSGSPNLAGHSFNAVGIVHGAEKANVAGCNTCHTKAISAKNATSTSGHLLSGDAYFDTGKTAPNTTLKHYDAMNKLMTALIDPVSGKGLLESALKQASIGAGSVGGPLSLSVSADGRGLLTLKNKIATDSAAVETSPKTVYAKAIYNYNYVREDKSFGVHNPTYAMQLLYDSCDALLGLGATSSVLPNNAMTDIFTARP